MITVKDLTFMRLALRLARKGAGKVSPNPMVGAVLVKNDQIIATGYHEQFGRAHAEVNAINSAREPVRDSTLYCTLEPCCHSNKNTPPCAQRIIKEGIKRVVIGSIDPNPEVSGKGIQLLRKAGIETEIGVSAAENDELNRFYIKYIKHGLPYVTVKIAQTIDGRIGLDRNRQTWLTSKRAQRLVHRWRSEYDAVLVGANTIRSDNPRLNVRAIRGRNPVRLVLSDSLDLPPDSLIFSQNTSARVIMFTGQESGSDVFKKIQKTGADVVHLADEPDRLRRMLSYLYKHNIASVLIEGGQSVFSQFIASGLADELQIFIAPKIFGRGVDSVSSEYDYTLDYHLYKSRKIDEDILLTYRKITAVRSMQ
jgi:diaminohydroxyphosphoribosylaminopyrimidine deaminase/5-amino-6-(5-phosphoribosylamino)uracil reductase